MKRQDFFYVAVGVNSSSLDLHFKLVCSSAEKLRFFVELLCKRFSVPLDHTASYSGKVNEKYPFGKYQAMLTKNHFNLHLYEFLRRWALDQIGIRIVGYEKFTDAFPASYLGEDFLMEVFSAATEQGWELFQWYEGGAVLLVHQ